MPARYFFKNPNLNKTFSPTHTSLISSNKILNLPNNYLSWSTADPQKIYGHGVTIIVKKPLADYIYKIQHFERYRIAITFAFKDNYHPTIITVYNLSFMNKPLPISLKLKKWTQKIINETKMKNQQIILTEDLNQMYRRNYHQSSASKQ